VAKIALLKYYCGSLLPICRAEYLRFLVIAATLMVSGITYDLFINVTADLTIT
jgi:hypothetical protein